MTSPDSTPVTIDVFADVGCPFAHAGLQLIADARRKAQADHVVFVIKAWPLEIINGAPFDPAVIAHKSDLLRDAVLPTGFAHVDEAAYAATFLPAMELTAAAYEQDLRVGEAVAMAVRSATFEEGLDVSDPPVLERIASRCGFVGPLPAGTARVEAAHSEGVERSVIGSPHFFGASEDFFCPSLSISQVEQADGTKDLAIKLDQAGFDSFLAAAFGALSQ